MSYKSILLCLDIDGAAEPLIKLATDLAKRFDAKLIGCSAADIVPPMVTMDGIVIDPEGIESQRTEIEARLSRLQQKFRALAGSEVGIEWRGGVAGPTELMIGMARAADLIVTGSPAGAASGSSYRSTNLGDLLLQAGRPLLVAASGAERVQAKKVLVAWKDSRESRRAVADSVPLLVDANEVVVATVAREETGQIRESAADVAAFLQRHGIKARAELLVGKDDAMQLVDLAKSIGADLVVSGAFGHSRLREWVFGGVTRSLLDEIGLNRLMSS